MTDLVQDTAAENTLSPHKPQALKLYFFMNGEDAADFGFDPSQCSTDKTQINYFSATQREIYKNQDVFHQ